MDTNPGRIFSLNCKKLPNYKFKKVTKLHSPVKLEEVKAILEQSLEKLTHSPCPSTKPKIFHAKAVKTATIDKNSKIFHKSKHFFAKFLRQSPKNPLTYKEMKARCASPSIRLQKFRDPRFYCKEGISIQTRKPQFPLKPKLSIGAFGKSIDKISESSSLSEFEELNSRFNQRYDH